MANILNITYNVFNETQLDTAFSNEEFIDEVDESDVSIVRNASTNSLMRLSYSPICAEETAANSSYFIKDNLTDADNNLQTISTLKTDVSEFATTKSTLQRSSIRKCCRKVYNSILKPIKLLKTSISSKIDTSEELSSISGLQYTSNTPSITQVTFDCKTGFDNFDRFKAVRLSSTKYESVKPKVINNRYLNNDYSLRKFNNFGDFEVWHI